ncbi:MAG TPA: choice-of-anchor tandem repeat GloVer-containing protein [Verrucomicrobiae bacterium]|nr:choice-of-anchor tandem repeat GloVer-containing protein [Verrucomicrobiae bacterium]
MGGSLRPTRFPALIFTLDVILFLAGVAPLLGGQDMCRTLHSFGDLEPDSSNPRCELIQGEDGALYGTAYSGGASNLGAVFKLNPDATGYRILWSFQGGAGDGAHPGSGLVRATNGALYGATCSGGASNRGTLFRLNPDGTGYALLRSFAGAEGANPCGALVQTTNGMLYGTTYSGGASDLGVVFGLALDGNGYTVLKSFTGTQGDGAHPRGALLLGKDGAFYGTTQTGGAIGNGTIFTLAPDGSSYAVLKSFGAELGEGAEPYSALIQATNGALYGTTLHGGTSGQGTVFRINPDGSGYAVIKIFYGIADGASPYAGLVQAPNGLLYGTVWSGGPKSLGGIYQINPDATGFKLLKSFTGMDGASPRASLLVGRDGFLYGTVEAEGSGVSGAVFKLSPDGSGFTDIKTFTGSVRDGVYSYSGVVQDTNGMLYGTAFFGGSAGVGAVFRVSPDGSNYSVLKSFAAAATDGVNPYGGLVWGSNGALYGTAMFGGSDSCGTVFTLEPDGSAFRVLKNFAGGSDGSTPYAALLSATNGVLYGSTYRGGSSQQNGTLFRINPTGTSYGTLHRFSGTNGDGATPMAALVQGANGALYGTTYSGGTTEHLGTVFTMNLDGSGYAVLKRFTGTNGDGALPAAALVQALDGALYGTTTLGGTFGLGTVFKLNPDDGSCATVLSFGRAMVDGAEPYAALVQTTDGVLYGATSAGGAYNQGTIFRLNPDGTGYAVVTSFAHEKSDGATPLSPLLLANDGTLYGTTCTGGTQGDGTVFNLIPPAFLLPPSPTAGGFQVQFSGIPGRTYTMQRAASLSGPWSTLNTFVLGPRGRAQFEDKQPPPGCVFYRTAGP